jgi:hypothetical protein
MPATDNSHVKTGRAEPAIAPFTAAQSRMLARLPLIADQAAFNVALRVTLRGPLDQTALETAARQLSVRHESLRSRIVRRGDILIQEVLGRALPDFSYADISSLPEPGRANALEQHIDSAARHSFDLASAPLIAFRLIRVAEYHHVLVVVAHHVVFDGASIGVLIDDLACLYTARVTGEPAGLTAPCQLGEYSEWEQGYLNRHLEDHLRFWQEHLDGADFTSRLPCTRSRPATRSGFGGSVNFSLPQEMLARVESIARSHRASVFTVMLAAFTGFVCCLTGQREIVICPPYAARVRPAHHNLIGLTASNLPMRLTLPPRATFTDLVTRTRWSLHTAMTNHVPFGLLLQSLTERGTVPGNWERRIAAVYQDIPATFPAMANLTMGVDEAPTHTAPLDLVLFMTRQGARLDGSFDYAADLYEADAVTNWVSGFRALLSGACNAEHEPIERLSARLSAT